MAKTPPAAPDALFCPLIGQGCIGAACMFWVGIWGNKGDGEPVLDETCAIVWNVHLGKETLIETARVSAGHDKAASQVNLLGHAIQRLRKPISP